MSLRLPHFLIAPFVVAETDLVSTLASRVARRFADAGLGLDLQEPPVEVPTWPLAIMWRRRDDAHDALAWLRGVVAEVAASV